MKVYYLINNKKKITVCFAMKHFLINERKPDLKIQRKRLKSNC